MMAKDGEIPWNCKYDFKHFKETTTGYPLVMGRKTFESLPGVLPGRPHIVITRNKEYEVPENVTVVNSIFEAFKLASTWNPIFYIIGGKEIYDLALSRLSVDSILLSVIDIEVKPDETSIYFEVPPEFSLFSETQKNGFTLKIFDRN